MARPNTGPRLKVNDFGYYEVHFTQAGRSITRSLKTKDEAEARRRFSPYLTANPATLANSEITLDRAFEIYLNESNSKWLASVRSVQKMVYAHLGHLKVCDIRPIHVHEYIKWATKAGRAYGTVYSDIAIVRRAVNYVYRTNVVPPSYLRPTFPVMKAANPKQTWITREVFDEWMAFLERRRTVIRRKEGADRTITYSRKRYSKLERYSIIACRTAARRHTIEQLPWSLVDFKNRVIHFDKLTDFQTTKTKANSPIDDTLYPWLEKFYAERISEYVLDAPTRIYTQWELNMEAFTKETGHKPFAPHDLRRSLATWMIKKEVPVLNVANILGNSVRRVQQVYGVHSNGDLLASLNKV